jgi:hypothetical protein
MLEALFCLFSIVGLELGRSGCRAKNLVLDKAKDEAHMEKQAWSFSSLSDKPANVKP